MLVPGIAQKFVNTPQDLLGYSEDRPPGYGEFLGASLASAFERTTTGAVLDEQRVLSAEREAYGARAPGFQEQALTDSFGGFAFGSMAPKDAGTAPVLITKEEWNENHPLYREGVEWRENMTEIRARIYAEDYDLREYRNRLLQEGDKAFGIVGGKAGGFIAGMLGSLPDPVNLIPFGRAFGAGRGFLAGAKRGAVEGALSNAAVDALVLPDLARRGADVGFADFTLDAAFGAALGGFLGGAGGYLGARRERLLEARRNALDALKSADEAEASVAREQAQRGVEAVNRPYDEFMRTLAEDYGEDRQGVSDASAAYEAFQRELREHARGNIHGRDRQPLLNAFELTADAVSDGRPVDVGQVPGIRESIGKAYDSVLDDPLGGPADEVLAVLRSPEFERIALERGPAFFDGQSGELIVRGRDIARMGYDASGVGLVKIIWRHGEKSKADPKLQVTREDIVSLPDMLVAYTPEPSGPRNRTMRWVVPDKSGISLVVVAGKRKGRSEPTTITLFKTDDSAKYPSSQKREAPASPNRRNPQRGQRTEGDTAEGTFGRDHQGQGLTARSLGPDEPEVNPYVEVPIGATLTREINGIATTAVKEVDGWAMYRDGKLRSRQKSKVQIVLFDDDWRRKNATSADSVSPRSPDFRVETPEEFTPAPPLSENARSALEDMGADPKTGTTLEEIQAVEQAELGLAPAEEAAALRVAQDAEVSRLRMEEEGYKLMGCIMEVSE